MVPKQHAREISRGLFFLDIQPFPFVFKASGVCRIAQKRAENCRIHSGKRGYFHRQGGKKGVLFFVTVSGIEGRPNVRRKILRIRLLKARVDLQRNLRI